MYINTLLTLCSLNQLEKKLTMTSIFEKYFQEVVNPNKNSKPFASMLEALIPKEKDKATSRRQSSLYILLPPLI